MKHLWLLIFPLLNGCLISFSSFNESDFLAAYESSMCELYVDCLDGVADGSNDVTNASTHRNECAVWTQKPSEQGCKVAENKALSCYEELTLLASDIQNGGSCDQLWESSSLPSCSRTYLDCLTDCPFGSVPPRDSQPGDPPVVESCTPLHGPEFSNTEVTIRGSGFDDTTAVQFDSASATILGWSDSELIVQRPDLPAGEHPIVVSNEHGEADPTCMYTAHREIPGMTGIVGYLETTEFTGGYWPPGQELLQTHAGMIVTASTNPSPFRLYHFHDRNARVGECIPTSTPGEIQPIITGYPEITLWDSMSSFPMTNAHDGRLEDYWANTSANWNAWYNLSADASEGWPAFELERVFEFPYRPNITTPNLDQSSPPKVSKGNLHFKWASTPNNEDYLYINLIHAETYARLNCFSDDFDSNGDGFGEFTIDRHFLLGDMEAEQYIVFVCHVLDSVDYDVLSPINNGQVVMSGINCIAGAIQISTDGTE